MKKLTSCLVIALIACAMALCVGCSSASSSSSAASASGSGAASGSAAASGAAAASASLANGEYTVDVALVGGSGEVAVESPAKLIVIDGAITATIVWSSPDYTQMVVDGVQYLPVPRTGNSTFQIPVSALDADIPVQVEIAAAGEPRTIDCVLRFDSGTLK